MRKASTEDLLNRVTVFREGMEPAAVDLMEGELARRGLSPEQIEAHDRARRAYALFWPDGSAVKCKRCDRPAEVQKLRWHRIFGRVPVFPWRVALCKEHE